MIRHMFVFGVMVPMVITVGFFLGFLVCWFKFNIREKIFKANLIKKKMQQKHSICPSECEKHASSEPRESWTDMDGSGGSERPNATSLTINVAAVKPNETPAQTSDPDAMSQCSMDDSDSARLCQTAEASPDSYCNPSLVKEDASWDEKKNLVENRSGSHPKAEIDHLIHQTFHFPDAQDRLLMSQERDQYDLDTDEDEDDNYAHFIPKEQIENAGIKMKAPQKDLKHEKCLHTTSNRQPYMVV